MKKLLLILMLTVSGWSAQDTIYCNSKNAAAGSGTFESPFKSLLSVTATLVNNIIAVGDTPVIALRDSSYFRDYGWTIPSGTEAIPVILTNYGDLGKKPVHVVASQVSTWGSYAGGLGSTWKASFSQVPGYCYLNDTLLTKGTDSTNLQNRQWFHGNGQAYLRLDGIDPDDAGIVELVSRTQVLTMNGSNIKIHNVVYKKSNGYAIRNTLASSNVEFRGCEFIGHPTWVSTAAATNWQFISCKFDTSTSGNQAMTLAGTNVKLIDCFVHDRQGTISISGTGPFYFNNCTIAKFNSEAITSSSSGTVYINNSIITGIYPYVRNVMTVTNGNAVINNSYVCKNALGMQTFGGNVTVNNPKYYYPKFVKTSMMGWYSIVMDDLQSVDPYLKIANVMESVDESWSGTMSVSQAFEASSSDSVRIRQISDLGHEIASHTNSHTMYYDGICGIQKIQYVSTAAACTLIVDTVEWKLKTKTTGGIDDVTIDIRGDYSCNLDSVHRTLENNSKYVYERGDSAHYRLPAYVLAARYNVDIKTNSDSVPLDTARYFKFDLDSSKLMLERFTGKSVTGYVYPGNFKGSKAFIQRLIGAGFIYGRANTIGSGVVSAGLALYEIPQSSPPNAAHCILMLDDNTNSSRNSTDFTGVNITYSTTVKADYSGSAVLNGTSYMYRSDTTFNYQFGDYVVSLWVRPDTLNAVNTVFYTGVSTDSCLSVYIDANGAINYIQKRSGSAVINLRSANGVVPLNQWTRLAFRQTVDTVSVFVGTDIPATTRVIHSHVSVTPDRYDGITYLGADLSSGSAANTFTGNFDKVDIGFYNWWNTIAVADQATAWGTLKPTLGHGDYLTPLDLYKVSIDACKYINDPNLQVKSISHAIEAFRLNGNVIGDTIVIWSQPDSADYRLRSDSKLSGAGDVSVLSGIPNLIDLSGDTITDASGNLVVSSVNIGAYGTITTLSDNTSPSIGTQPINDTTVNGGSASFTVSVSGTEPLSYKWTLAGDSIGTTNTLNLSNVTLGMSGNYYKCVVTNEFGSVTSDSALLIVEEVRIDSIRPSPWYRNRAVSIYGKWFGSSQGSDSVLVGGINNHRASLWSNTQIVDTLPDTVGVFQVHVKGASQSLRILKPRAR